MGLSTTLPGKSLENGVEWMPRLVIRSSTLQDSGGNPLNTNPLRADPAARGCAVAQLSLASSALEVIVMDCGSADVYTVRLPQSPGLHCFLDRDCSVLSRCSLTMARNTHWALVDSPAILIPHRA